MDNETISTYDIIARSFKVKDIASPILWSITPDKTRTEIWDEIIPDLDIKFDWFLEPCIVRDDKKIYGYLFGDSEIFQVEEEGCVGDNLELFTPDILVPSSMPIIDLFPIFEKENYLFVLTKNDITHFISFSNLNRLPVQMCIFSLIMKFESEIVRYYNHKQPHYLFRNLPENILYKALKLCLRNEIDMRKSKYQKMSKYVEKAPNGPTKDFAKMIQRENEQLEEFLKKKELRYSTFEECLDDICLISVYDVLDNFTLYDRIELIKIDNELFSKLPFESEEKFYEYFKKLRKVRNEIAHSGSIFKFLENPKEFNIFIRKLQEINNKLSELLGREMH
ncbi:MAG: hypothetical protein HWN67_09585 [Candidatus Helarchaeota archaeon]|nr:hypothetical protein [Candidatus Helarchaeota archaeon]